MEEMNKLKQNCTWDIVELPKDKKTFAPVAKINTIRILLSVPVNFD